MHPSKVQRGELVAIVGGLLLALGVFMKWYYAEGPNVRIASHGAGTYSAWQVHHILRFLLLAAAVAPLILAYIVARDHKLSWPRGEVTSLVAIAAIGLIFYNGIVGRPGDPASLVHLRIGWVVALIGAAAMLGGSVIRQGEQGPRRKPPGTV